MPSLQVYVRSGTCVKQQMGGDGDGMVYYEVYASWTCQDTATAACTARQRRGTKAEVDADNAAIEAGRPRRATECKARAYTQTSNCASTATCTKWGVDTDTGTKKEGCCGTAEGFCGEFTSGGTSTLWQDLTKKCGSKRVQFLRVTPGCTAPLFSNIYYFRTKFSVYMG